MSEEEFEALYYNFKEDPKLPNWIPDAVFHVWIKQIDRDNIVNFESRSEFFEAISIGLEAIKSEAIDKDFYIEVYFIAVEAFNKMLYVLRCTAKKYCLECKEFTEINKRIEECQKCDTVNYIVFYEEDNLKIDKETNTITCECGCKNWRMTDLDVVDHTYGIATYMCENCNDTNFRVVRLEKDYDRK